MKTPTGYIKIEEIYESKRILVYRAICKKSQKKCIVKIAQKEYPSSEIIKGFNTEFNAIKKCDQTATVPYLEFGKSEERPFIVMEDVEAITIKDYCKNNTLSFKEFIQIAINIARTLDKIHNSNIVHKDINPKNILINPVTKAIHIIDFEIATHFSKEIIEVSELEHIEGTLLYIAPEQTGRINQSIDFRSDLYALGITFYEMLGKRVPFESNDLIELVHAHIAKAPQPLLQLNPEIPVALSNIVLKLIEKSADNRYQSISGLVRDLEFVAENLNNPEVLAGFQLAKKDVSSSLQLPEKTYGRNKELQKLFNCLEESKHNTNILLAITGSAGIGKSQLINELQKEVLVQKGYFAKSVCEKTRQETPYFPLLAIFKSLIKLLLAESEQEVIRNRELLISKLKGNGNVLIGLIPELEILIGQQEPLEPLGAYESQNRLTEAFVILIDFFSHIASPLVFVFEDMQWVDKPTLHLLKSLILNDSYKHLFLVGAYRNNEIDETHPLYKKIHEIKQAGRLIEEINLKNLKQPDISELLVDTLKLKTVEIEPLAKIIFKKTEGHPFFVKEFLKQIKTDKLLQFNSVIGRWTWDIDKISYLNITENVVKLMEEKVLYLPGTVLDLLKNAACISNVFNADILVHLCRKSWSEIKTDLWHAIDKGFLTPLGNNYDFYASNSNLDFKSLEFRFQHDKMLDVLYNLIPQKKREKKHLAIAQYLDKNIETQNSENRIELVNHYNKALSVLSKKEKEEVCKLNYEVGIEIKDAAAYSIAIDYFKSAAYLLPRNYWIKTNEFASALFNEMGACEYLLGNGKKAEELFIDTYVRTKDQIQKLKIVNSQIAQFIHQANYNQAISIAIDSLENSDEYIVNDEIKLKKEIDESFHQLNRFLEKKQISTLLDKVSTDEKQILITNILSSILESSFMIGKVNLTILAALKIIKYCIKNGVNKNAALGFAYFGTFYNTFFKNLEKGYVFGNFAVKLGQHVKNPKTFHKVLVLHGFMCSFIKEPLINSTQILNKAYFEAKQNGDYAFANYALCDEIIVNHLIGNKISSTQQLLANYGPFVKNTKIELIVQLTDIYSNILDTYNIQDTNFDELISAVLQRFDDSVAYFKSINYLAGIGIVQILVSEFLFINKAYNKALKVIEQNPEVKLYLKGFANEIAFYFYYSLSICKNYNKLDANSQKKNKEILARNLLEIKKYSDSNPSNFLHFYALAYAEQLRIENKNWEAIENYELGILNAQKNNNIMLKALGNELLADFYLSKGNRKVFNTYIETASYNYHLLENHLKVKQLELENSGLETNSESYIDSNTKGFAKTIDKQSNKKSRNFDLTTAIKFAQNISQEVNLEKLLIKTMAIIIENAGATSGSLLLCADDKFYIEAEAFADDQKVRVLKNIELSSLQLVDNTEHHLSIDIVNYVIRTKEIVVLNNALEDTKFARSEYLQRNQIKSVLCLPLVKQGALSSILYLENRLTANVFTNDHLQLLKHLSSQISISIDNARLYENLENKIDLRTQEVVAQKTEMERAYNELQIQKEELQRFAKQLEVANQTKDKFFSIIAHDLRSPFGALLNLTDLLYKNYNNYDEDRRKYFIKKLNDASKNTFDLLQNLLTWSMSQNNTIIFEPQFHSINELIDNAISVVKQLAQEKNIEIKNLSKSIEVAYIDKNMILTVIRNLISNAIKFTPENGKITIDCTRLNLNTIKVSISDSGVGMTQQQIDNLFEINEKNTTLGTNNEKGTGLGLILCKDFIDRHKGGFIVESTVQQGSTFSFTIPFE